MQILPQVGGSQSLRSAKCGARTTPWRREDVLPAPSGCASPGTQPIPSASPSHRTLAPLHPGSWAPVPGAQRPGPQGCRGKRARWAGGAGPSSSLRPFFPLRSTQPSLRGRWCRCQAVLGPGRLPCAGGTGWKLGSLAECGAPWGLGTRLPAARSPSQLAAGVPGPLAEIWAPSAHPQLHPTGERDLSPSTPLLLVGLPPEPPGGWRRAAASAWHSGKTSPPGVTSTCVVRTTCFVPKAEDVRSQAGSTDCGAGMPRSAAALSRRSPGGVGGRARRQARAFRAQDPPSASLPPFFPPSFLSSLARSVRPVRSASRPVRPSLRPGRDSAEQNSPPECFSCCWVSSSSTSRCLCCCSSPRSSA